MESITACGLKVYWIEQFITGKEMKPSNREVDFIYINCLCLKIMAQPILSNWLPTEECYFHSTVKPNMSGSLHTYVKWFLCIWMLINIYTLNLYVMLELSFSYVLGVATTKPIIAVLHIFSQIKNYIDKEDRSNQIGCILPWKGFREMKDI